LRCRGATLPTHRIAEFNRSIDHLHWNARITFGAEAVAANKRGKAAQEGAPDRGRGVGGNRRAAISIAHTRFAKSQTVDRILSFASHRAAGNAFKAFSVSNR
jgi:hypothetical protein